MFNTQTGTIQIIFKTFNVYQQTIYVFTVFINEFATTNTFFAPDTKNMKMFACSPTSIHIF